MYLSPSIEQLATDDVAACAGVTERCEASNFRWERAVTDERAREYCNYVEAVVEHKDWKAGHKEYVGEYVQIAKDLPRSSESFLALNHAAHLHELMDDTWLLRLESIDRLFGDPLIADVTDNFWWRFYRSQNDLLKDNLPDEAEALRSEFVTQWNGLRTQARPQFATFLNDFGGNLKDLLRQDWPHMLRDRLGLTHWPSTPGKPLPVALVSYSVQEVRAARLLAENKGAVAGFCRPTALDAEMSAAFIPAPLSTGNQSYGYTLDLSNPGIPESFSPELLTFPIEYLPRHIKGLGFISRQHALLEPQAMLEARNRHVQGLRKLSSGADFGEVLA